MSKKKCVSYYVHEVSEFPSLGICYENIESPARATELFNTLVKKSCKNGVPCIGVSVKPEGEPDDEATTYDLVFMSDISLDLLPYYEEITECNEAMLAIMELIDLHPDKEILGDKKVLTLNAK